MNIPLLKSIASTFNGLQRLAALAFPIQFEFGDLADTDMIVTNISTNEKLTCLFLDNFFPAQHGTFQHFTHLPHLKNMLSKQAFHLSSVHKRFGEKEFRTFYTNHGMTAYRDQARGDKKLEEAFTLDAFIYPWPLSLLTRPHSNTCGTLSVMEREFN